MKLKHFLFTILFFLSLSITCSFGAELREFPSTKSQQRIVEPVYYGEFRQKLKKLSIDELKQLRNTLEKNRDNAGNKNDEWYYSDLINITYDEEKSRRTLK